MTNPTQLKYLEAMGIPVWVSRELIVEGTTDVIVEEGVGKSNRSSTTLNTPVEKNAVGTTPQEKRISSAESLMNSLDSQTQKSKNQASAPTAKTTSPLNAPQEVDDSSNISSNSNHASNNDPNNASQYLENLIGRTALHTVFASGNLDADWMVIGQSPDVNDSAMYQPYPYEAGELLSNMLKATGIEKPREQSYWINTLKSSKRVENKEELEAAIELNHLLTEKIKQIKPKMILLVGQLAAQNLLQSKEPLARLRLQQQEKALILENSIPTVVTYYPSYLLSKPQDKAKTWRDLKLAISLLAAAKDE